MPMMSKKDAAYLAGLVDAEGYIGILKRKNGGNDNRYCPVLKVVMTDRKIVEWLYRSFGGAFYLQSKLNDKNAYGWMLRKAGVSKFLKYLLPFLKIKRKDAEVIMEYGIGKRTDNLKWDGQFGYLTKTELQRREYLYQKAINLHRVQRERPSEPNIQMGYMRWPTPFGNKRMTKLDRAYLAGLMDGDGWIGTKSNGTKGFQIALKHKETILWIAERIKGKIYIHRFSNPKWSDSWFFTANEIISPIRKIEPYLRLKREAAKSILSN